jgi:hypothetical protein
VLTRNWTDDNLDVVPEKCEKSHQSLDATPAGVEHFVERHELGLFADAEYRNAFAAAGLRVERDPEGLTGRGLYLARAEPMPNSS